MVGDRRDAVESENLRDPVAGDKLFGLSLCTESIYLLMLLMPD